MIQFTQIASSSKSNAYIIDDGKTKCLIEAGVSVTALRRAMDFKLHEVSACFITHEHGDHSRHALKVMESGIDCYMSQGTAKMIVKNARRCRVVRPKNILSVQTWDIMPFDVSHDAAEPLGFLFRNGCGERLLFAIDTCSIRYNFSGITHLAVECNHSRKQLYANIKAGHIEPYIAARIMKNHMSLETLELLIKMNDLSRVQEIHLLHLSALNADPQEFKDKIQKQTGCPVIIKEVLQNNYGKNSPEYVGNAGR